MPKVKKNGKLPKPKAKAKPKAEREDNIKSSSTKSKSVNQHQNVNVSVSIVKNKTGGSSKSGEASNTSGSNQMIKPKPQPQPQNVYYQQPNKNNDSELTTLLKDMNKQLYAQRDIKALNQPLINPIPNPLDNKTLFGNPQSPAIIGGNNIFQHEPFEELNEDLAPVPETPTKTVPETPATIYKDPPYLNKLLFEPEVPVATLSNEPNPFEGKRLASDVAYGTPLTPGEIPVEDIELKPIFPKRLINDKTAMRKATNDELIQEILRLRITDVTNMPYDEGYLQSLRKKGLKTILSQMV